MKGIIKKAAALMSGLAVMLTSAVNLPDTEPIKTEAASNNGVIAFPGAVGGGKYATGGRGGEVVHVTNLNDSGAGSFRDAVSKPNRIVVFDVSGTIELKGNILCQSNITIAGQTAPGGSGITLKNYKMGMSGDNIICRYISSRPGPYASTSSGNDAWGGAKGSNSIIDHCSMGWTTDEQWGLYSNNEYYTVQYSVLGPADSWGGHKKGLHGFGIMMGKGSLTFDHNLIIHNVSRNFRGKVPGTYTADFTNNIIYDWGYQTAYGTIGHLNYVNNTLKAGKSTTGGYHWMYVDSTTSPKNFKVYCSGNQMINKDGTMHGITYDNWSGVTVKESIGITKNDLYSASAFQTLVNGENVSTATTAESAAASYDHVIAYAGNGISSDKRTDIDKQCAYETKTGTGTCSGTSAYDASVSDLNKYSIACGVNYQYPSPVLTKTIKDSDNDGMPDDWELARGLDPNDPSDTNGDYCGQGYTNIEYYINDLTVDSFPPGVVKTSPAGTFEKKSAFDRTEAEDFNEQSGVQAEDMAGGGQNVGYIESGDYIAFKNLDFTGGARSFTANLAGNAANIEIYLDKISGTPAATCAFDGSGGWQNWKECTFGIPNPITGSHTVYLRFTGGDGYLLNIDWFRFGKDAVPVNGRLIKDLQIKDTERASAWSIADNTKVGDLIFGDRDFTYTELPDWMNGLERLKTACDSKNASGDLASFKTADYTDVYIAFDNRLNQIPSWASDYKKTEFTAKTSNDVTFDLYYKSFQPGETVELGTNGQAAYCINYTVFAAEGMQPPPAVTTPATTEPAETTATTVTTTTEPVTTEPVITTTEPVITTEPPEIVDTVGDINGDKVTDLSDMVMLQKFLLGTGELTAAQGFAADVDHNGKLNVFDLIIIKRIVIPYI